MPACYTYPVFLLWFAMPVGIGDIKTHTPIFIGGDQDFILVVPSLIISDGYC